MLVAQPWFQRLDITLHWPKFSLLRAHKVFNPVLKGRSKRTWKLPEFKVEWLATGGWGAQHQQNLSKRERVSKFSCHLSVQLVVNYSGLSSSLGTRCHNNLIRKSAKWFLTAPQRIQEVEIVNLKTHRFWPQICYLLKFRNLNLNTNSEQW